MILHNDFHLLTFSFILLILNIYFECFQASFIDYIILLFYFHLILAHNGLALRPQFHKYYSRFAASASGPCSYLLGLPRLKCYFSKNAKQSSRATIYKHLQAASRQMPLTAAAACATASALTTGRHSS
jgi:hypothetical protein